MSLVRVNLLYMSACGGMLVLTVLCLRPLLKNRLPKRTFAILWCVALLRLLIPFSVDSPVGVFSVIQDRVMVFQDHGAADIFSESFYFGRTSGYDNGIGGFSGGGNIVNMDGTPADMEGNPADQPTDSGYRQGVWGLSLIRGIGIGGTMVCAAVFLMLYISCLRRFKTALPVEDPSVEQWLGRNRLLRRVRVCQSDRIFSPLTYGLIRPVILLPKLLEQENGQKLEYILQHEMVHIRRFDGAWKLAMAAALCLHWFNPLVWVMYVFMNRDLELSCDEEVLRIFGTEARKGYALTLIGMEERRSLPMPLYSGFGKNAVEERIGEIMKYKKKTKIAMCAGAALILTVVCMFATTKMTNENKNFSEADAGLPEDAINTTLPMDPPTGVFVETDGADGSVGSDTAAGTDSNAAPEQFSVVTPEITENVSVGGAVDTDYREAEEKIAEAEMSRWMLQKLTEAYREEEMSHWLFQKLIEASREEDHSSINQYLAEGYEVDMDCLDWIKEWKQGTINVRFHPADDRCEASVQVITTESEADSNDYLTVELLKEGEDWKICFMGLEK